MDEKQKTVGELIKKVLEADEITEVENTEEGNFEVCFRRYEWYECTRDNRVEMDSRLKEIDKYVLNSYFCEKGYGIVVVDKSIVQKKGEIL